MNRFLGFIGLIAAVVGAITSLAFRATPKVGLELCNRSDRDSISVAVAYPSGKGSWITEGWINLEQGKCNTAIATDLKNRYYYYFAETPGDYAWKGDHQFCVSDRSFTFAEAEKSCKGINSRWESFRILDTGKDAMHYTLNLE